MKVDRIQDEGLRASLQAAHASLRAGDHRDVVQRAGEAYIELLRRKPELLQGEGAMPQMRIFMFPRLCAHLEVEDGRPVAVAFDRENIGFPEAVTYYEFAVDNLVREGL
ncbi:MAG: hypothetical protein IVW36_10505 [Dehalococcoidia bacterium]|nr:hypothetical protein [Dehalococcoidia bacterium]